MDEAKIPMTVPLTQCIINEVAKEMGFKHEYGVNFTRGLIQDLGLRYRTATSGAQWKATPEEVPLAQKYRICLVFARVFFILLGFFIFVTLFFIFARFFFIFAKID